MCGHQSQTSPFQLAPLGGILEKMFRLNRNRCQSCQQRQITDEPIGGGLSVTTSFRTLFAMAIVGLGRGPLIITKVNIRIEVL